MTTTSAGNSTHTDMLKLVRCAAHHSETAITKRDAAIREAHRAGASLRELAVECGISHMSVKRIIERSTDRPSIPRLPASNQRPRSS